MRAALLDPLLHLLLLALTLAALTRGCAGVDNPEGETPWTRTFSSTGSR